MHKNHIILVVLIVVVIVAIFFVRKDTDKSEPSLLDAKRLELKNMEKPVVSKADEEGEINYYVNRHAAAVQSGGATSPVARRNPNLSFVTYSRAH